MEVLHALLVTLMILINVKALFAANCQSTDTTSVVQVCTSGSITGSYLSIDTGNVSSSATVCSCSVSLGGNSIQHIDYSGPDTARDLCGIEFRFNNMILSCQSTFLSVQTVNEFKYSQENNPVSTACLSMKIGGTATVTCYESGITLPPTQPQSTTTTTTTTTTPTTTTTTTTTTTSSTTTTKTTTTTSTTTTTTTSTTTTPSTTKKSTTTTTTTQPPTTQPPTTKPPTTQPPTTQPPTTQPPTTQPPTTKPPTTQPPTTQPPTTQPPTTKPPTTQPPRPTTPQPTESGSGENNKQNQKDVGVMIGIILGGLGGMFILAAIIIICIIKRKQRIKKPLMMTQYHDYPGQLVVNSSFSDDIVMTANPMYDNRPADPRVNNGGNQPATSVKSDTVQRPSSTSGKTGEVENTSDDKSILVRAAGPPINDTGSGTVVSVGGAPTPNPAVQVNEGWGSPQVLHFDDE